MIQEPTIKRTSNRWIKVASAYPLSPTSRNRRGIDKTDWLPIDRSTYDACIDHRDYRPMQDDRGIMATKGRVLKTLIADRKEEAEL